MMMSRNRLLFNFLVLRFTKYCASSYSPPLIYQPQAQQASLIYAENFQNPTAQNRIFLRKYLSSESSAVTMTEIKFDEVKKALEDKTLALVDVREPKELVQDGKIPGSINVPLGEWDAALNLTKEKFTSTYGASIPSADESDKLILSCRSGRRAVAAVETAKKHGYDKVLWYSGSFLDWESKGGPIEKP